MADRIETAAAEGSTKTSSGSLISQIFDHTKKSWSDVFHGNGTANQYLEVGTEAVVGALLLKPAMSAVEKLFPEAETSLASSRSLVVMHAPHSIIAGLDDVAAKEALTMPPISSTTEGGSSAFLSLGGTFDKEAWGKAIHVLPENQITWKKPIQTLSGSDVGAGAAASAKEVPGVTEEQIWNLVNKTGGEGARVAAQGARDAVGEGLVSPSMMQSRIRDYAKDGAEAYLTGKPGNSFTKYLANKGTLE